MSKFLLEHAPANPTIEYAQNIKVPVGATEIISRGGGSTIDVAKWVAKKYGLRHTAIPTTGGTGSEVTKYVVLTVDGEKKTFTDEKFRPQAYVLDPHLSVSLPYEHTLASGLDALSQSMESLWSLKATPESVNYAFAGMELALQNLETALRDPANLQARMNMLLAGNLSGKAIDITQTNICHAISYPLTDWYGIPHGIACGLVLPYFAEKMGFKIKKQIKHLLPKYKIDRRKVAKHVINSPKLLDFPAPVTEMDIYKSLL